MARLQPETLSPEANRAKTPVSNAPESARAPEVLRFTPGAAVPPSALLWLQQSAGNQAAVALIQKLGTSDRRTAAVLQRTPLSKDKLNVAGEDHKVSDERRRNEEEYAKAETGGDYWREREFRADPSVREMLKGRTQGRRGDPLMLKLRHLLALQVEVSIPEFLTPFVARTMPPKLGEGLSERDSDKIDEAWALFCKDIYVDEIDEIVRVLMFASADEAEKDEARKATNLSLHLGPLRAVVASSTKAQDAAVVKGSMENAIAGFLQSLGLKPGDLTRASATLRRSEAMHGAAQGSSKKGLWKVGDEHIPQMKQSLPWWSSRGYEILTEDEFDEHFLRSRYAPPPSVVRTRRTRTRRTRPDVS